MYFTRDQPVNLIKIRCTVKLVIVATSIKQATCIKQACIQIPKQASTLNVPVLSKHLS